jgi:hypothetical protein
MARLLQYKLAKYKVSQLKGIYSNLVLLVKHKQFKCRLTLALILPGS